VKYFNFKNRKFLLNKTYIMGILNITPDSFFDGGKFNTLETALKRALEIEQEGADFLDIGAQSTRPGFTQISQEEEWQRLEKILKAILKEVKIPVSVDSFYPYVIEKSLDLGAEIINDVHGFKDKKMLELAKKYNSGCILMANTCNDKIIDFFNNKINKMLELGIKKESVCLDPGVGFEKTHEENLNILKNCEKYRIFNCGMLIGASRKRVTGIPCNFNERLSATISAHVLSISGGANIIRVHDVKESVQAFKMADAVINS